MNISLHEPEFDATDEQLVLETLRSSWVSTGGPFVERFEREFAEYTGMKYAVSVCNGTIALQLILTTLARTQNVSEPFDVIVPTLSFIATPNAVVHAGGHPIFVDCAPNSLNLCPTSVETLIKEHYSWHHSVKLWKSKTTNRPLLAVMPAHIMGWSTRLEELQAICSTLHVALVEDAAEALGCFSKTEKKHLGYHGIAAAFSFNGNKILTTGGGGMIVTDDKEFATRAKHLSTTAKTDGLRFHHDEVGYNYRLVNILAALGCSQLQKLPGRLTRKNKIAEIYKNCLAVSKKISVHEESNCISNNWLVNLVFQTETQREAALCALISDKIQARPLWELNHKQAACRQSPQPMKAFPHATAMHECTLSVPSSPQLEDKTIEKICSIVLEAVSSI